MDKVTDTINGVLGWATVLGWAEKSHQAEWRRLIEAAQGEMGDAPMAVQLNPPAMFTAQTYLIAMALEQMENRLRWLQHQKVLSGKAGPTVTEFLTLFHSEELKDLRDVLAHAHDYAVGKDANPSSWSVAIRTRGPQADPSRGTG
jgi:hypothetical protein